MKNPNFKNDLCETYNKYAQERDSSIHQDWKIGERERFLLAMQRENKSTLLEIGAGPGRDSLFFQDQGFSVTCIDLSPAMVELCKLKGLNARVMDMTEINLPDNSFDAVYTMNSLLHLPKDEFKDVLLRIISLLRTEGLFFLGMYGGYDFEGISEKDTYTPKRFFSFFDDEHLQEEIVKVFDILEFNRIITEPGNPLHFQSLMLRKKSVNLGAASTI